MQQGVAGVSGLLHKQGQNVAHDLLEESYVTGDCVHGLPEFCEFCIDVYYKVGVSPEKYITYLDEVLVAYESSLIMMRKPRPPCGSVK